MRILPKAIMMTAISTLLINQMNAHCSKCEKIEADREKEQADNPQPWRYFDDITKLHIKDDSPHQNQLPTAPEEEENKEVAIADSPEINDSMRKNEENRMNSTNQKRNPNPNPNQSGSTFENASQISSALYTIFKTKNFLEALDGSFTLFIPTDKAFSQLPQGTLEKLLLPENSERLAALVSNHVLAHKHLPKNFSHRTDVKAISGKKLKLYTSQNGLAIENAQILRVEPAGYDGVIYIIDKVLIDKASTP